MKIAVVGAGIFGCTISTKVSNFCNVDLYDMSSDIMSSASRTNQLRLHRGYHYPRSPDTVSDLLNSINFFIEEYTENKVQNIPIPKNFRIPFFPFLLIFYGKGENFLNFRM